MNRKELNSGIAILGLIAIIAISGCVMPGEVGVFDDKYKTAKEEYVIGWKMRNISDTTPTNLSYSEGNLARYNFVYNYPDDEPSLEIYSLMKEPLLKSEIKTFASLKGGIAIPSNRTYWVKTNNSNLQSYRTNWSFVNYVRHDGVEQKYDSCPGPGKEETVFLGGPSYLPSGFKVRDSISLRGSVLKGKGNRSYLTYSERPEISIKNKTSSFEGKINWEEPEFEHGLENKAYNVSLTGSTNYSVWSEIKIKAHFNASSSDKQPPWLVEFNSSSRVKSNKSFSFYYDFKDDNDVNYTAFMVYQDPHWDTSILEPGEGFKNYTKDNNTIPIDNPNETQKSISIVAEDTSGNWISYNMGPVALPAKELNLTLNTADNITEGYSFNVSGELQNGYDEISQARIKSYQGDKYLGSAITDEDGEYSKGIDTKCFNSSQINITVVFPGSGVFSKAKKTKKTNIQRPIYDIDMGAAPIVPGQTKRISVEVNTCRDTKNISLFTNETGKWKGWENKSISNTSSKIWEQTMFRWHNSSLEPGTVVKVGAMFYNSTQKIEEWGNETIKLKGFKARIPDKTQINKPLTLNSSVQAQLKINKSDWNYTTTMELKPYRKDTIDKYSFESGLKGNWTTWGDKSWTRSNLSSSGDYSIGAGNITHDEKSGVSFIYKPNSDSLLSFDYKVSSESSFNYLKLYLNGELKFKESGLTDWKTKKTLLEAGKKYNITWLYDKNSNVSESNDTAYLDNVMISNYSMKNMEELTLHNYGDYNFKVFVENRTGDVINQTSKTVFSNVTEKPSINRIGLSPHNDFPTSDRIQPFIGLRSESDPRLNYYNITNLSAGNNWEKDIKADLNHSSKIKEDDKTSEAYNSSNNFSIKRKRKLNPGKYKVEAEISDKAGQEAKGSFQRFVYPLRNVNITINNSGPQNYEVNFWYWRNGEWIRTYHGDRFSGSENFEVPKVSYFENQAPGLYISNYSERAICNYSERAIFKNISLNRTMEIVTDSIDLNGTETGSILLYDVKAYNNPYNYSSSNVSISIPDYNTSDFKDKDNVSLYNCKSWDFSSNNCNSEWSQLKTNVDNKNHSLLLNSEANYTEAFAVGENEYCGNGYCGSAESPDDCPEDCGEPEKNDTEGPSPSPTPNITTNISTNVSENSINISGEYFKNNKSHKIDTSEFNSSLTELEIKAREFTLEGEIKIRKVNEVNSETKITEVKDRENNVTKDEIIAYEYLNISASFPVNSTIEFKVRKSWMEENNVKNVYLTHYINQTWERVPTKQIEEKSGHTLYRANIGQYSLYSIAGEREMETVFALSPDRNSCEKFNKSEMPENWTELDGDCPPKDVYGTKNGECKRFNYTVPGNWEEINVKCSLREEKQSALDQINKAKDLITNDSSEAAEKLEEAKNKYNSQQFDQAIELANKSMTIWKENQAEKEEDKINIVLIVSIVLITITTVFIGLGILYLKSKGNESNIPDGVKPVKGKREDTNISRVSLEARINETVDQVEDVKERLEAQSQFGPKSKEELDNILDLLKSAYRSESMDEAQEKVRKGRKRLRELKEEKNN